MAKAYHRVLRRLTKISELIVPEGLGAMMNVLAMETA
jgi:hypothetical protein